MAKILRHSEVVHTETFTLEFQRKSGSGFSFPCDKDGKVAPLNPVAAESLRRCRAGEFPDLMDKGVQKWTHRNRIPMLIQCDACERKLELPDGATNQCECGTFYNGRGQRLAPPSQWGEETGERFSSDGSPIL